MAAIKFPCSICNKMMATGEEFAGKRVRCPHCQQVIIAAVPTIDGGTSGEPFNFAGSAMPSGIKAGPDVESEPPPSMPSYEVESFSEPETQDEAPRAVRSNTGAASGRSNWLLGILAPYAVFMTVVAIWYFMKYSNAVRDHPLEMIPDLLGEYQKEIKKDGKPVVRAIKLPPPDQALPEKLITSLGKPIRIGAIEVTPTSIEYRPWNAIVKEKNREQPVKKPFTSLILHVRLKNTSPDLTFYPTDPYFDRRPKNSNEKPYALLDVDGRKIFGGVIEYVTEPGNTERTWLEGQDNDNKPLGPGESRDTVFVTHPSDKAFELVQAAKNPVVWRMHVRRGLTPFHEKEVPVTAVVGVTFTAADVRKSG